MSDSMYWCCNADFGTHEKTCKNYVDPVPVPPSTPPPLPDCAACVVPDQGVAHVEGTRQHPRVQPVAPQGSAAANMTLEQRAYQAYFEAQAQTSGEIVKSMADFAEAFAAEQRAEIERLRAELANQRKYFQESREQERKWRFAAEERAESAEASVRKMREERDGMKLVIERDRTMVCDGVTALRKILREREWLGEGRGPYEWDDDRWHDEFNATAEEIREAIAGLEKIAADLSNSPTTWEEVQKARSALAAPDAPSEKENGNG